MSQDAELKQLAATVEVRRGLDELATEIRKLRITDPDFAELVRIQLARIISHLQSEQRSRVTHGITLMDHEKAIEVHRKILEGTADQEGISVFVKNWRKRNNYVLGLLIGLAVKAIWEMTLK